MLGIIDIFRQVCSLETVEQLIEFVTYHLEVDDRVEYEIDRILDSNSIYTDTFVKPLLGALVYIYQYRNDPETLENLYDRVDSLSDQIGAYFELDIGDTALVYSFLTDCIEPMLWNNHHSKYYVDWKQIVRQQ